MKSKKGFQQKCLKNKLNLNVFKTLNSLFTNPLTDLGLTINLIIGIVKNEFVNK